MSILQKLFKPKHIANPEMTQDINMRDYDHIHCPQCSYPIYRKDFDKMPEEIADLLNKASQ